MKTFAALLLVTTTAGAQVRVTGLAYDSLRNAPLNGAFVTVAGTSRSALSDAAGRFTIDSVPAGVRTFVMQHEALDSLGLPSVSRRVNVVEGANVEIVVPSFPAIWKRVCDAAPPRDSGLVFGVVSDASGSRRVRDASIEVSWFDYVVDANNKVSQRRRVGRVRSDSTGAFALCGVPSSMALELHASTSRGRSGALDLMPGTWRVLRRDLRIADDADSLRRGTVAGMVTRNASPFENARVIIAGLPEVRSDRTGRFVVRDVPTGTRQVEITAIGLTPAVFTVDITAGDTAFVARDIAKLVELPGVKVSAPTVRQRLVEQYLERKKGAIGRFRDSTDLAKYAALEQVLREVPGMQIKLRGTSNRVAEYWLRSAHGPCRANILIDNVNVEQAQMQWIDRDDIAALEVYSDGDNIPLEIASKLRRNTSTYPCGALVIWTKQFMVP